METLTKLFGGDENTSQQKQLAVLYMIEQVFVFNLPMSCLPPDLFTGSIDPITQNGEN